MKQGLRALHSQLACLTVLALIAVAGSATTAWGASVRCGVVITASTTLTADVGPCNQGGLIVRADNITLNLGGHTIFGTGRAGDGIGLRLDHVTGVVVRNGTVTNFDAGVAIEFGQSNMVTEITAHDNIGQPMRKRTLGDGILIRFSNNNVITGNQILNNGPFSGIGIANDVANPSLGATGNVIANNLVQNNDVARDTLINEDDGIRIEGPNATDTVIQGNTVLDNGLDGIAVFTDRGTGYPNAGTSIADNTVKGNGFHDKAHRKGNGIVLFGAPTNPSVRGADFSTIQGNLVQSNAANGVRVASQNNRILANTATGNAAYRGVTAYDLSDSNRACDNNVWQSNIFGTANKACTTQ